jgi:type IV secretory pathway VirB10-like protein
MRPFDLAQGKRARYSSVVVMLLSMGCMHDRKPDTQPPPVAAKPVTSKTPQTTKAAPAPTPVTKAPAAKTPASTTKAKPKGQAAPPQAAKAPATKPPAAAPAPRAAVATLDLEALKTQLKQTKAIGLMTKLSLKNQVDDLLDKFRKHHSGNPTPTMAELRRSYDLLMMKVLSLLQDHDQKLASDIVSSRERIWGLLADPKKFAAVTA